VGRKRSSFYRCRVIMLIFCALNPCNIVLHKNLIFIHVFFLYSERIVFPTAFDRARVALVAKREILMKVCVNHRRDPTQSASRS